ncbi:hypothetical protein BT63DRAFT_399692 [Microthyrium microscopicum]|uniref:Uncharacterized protein n=1 Tax=Microthyrium microscopicum TaxID=703497 RepID=A0A6A6UIH7_9PEZI|nr:hypothetical protein BT63DRAFT_399692 [Microthyrium microscopicum]
MADTRNGSQSGASNVSPSNTTQKKSKGKTQSKPDLHQAIQSRMNELQGIQEADKELELEITREVKKANRELSSKTAQLDPLSKATLIQERWAKLLTEMKRLERDNQKSKRRADTLQKERDTAKSELTKMTSIKDKLEKLSRDSMSNNKKLQV